MVAVVSPDVKQGHEAVTEKFVDHATVFAFHRFHHRPQKLVQESYRFGR
ncbi:MAG TPA: hypothetical protein VM717_02305 [Chthoniobacterales bacterium]|jgi:hypothetical protein|nr:hypothetical protein [Chthoniobacterales bacterium]